MTTLKNVRRVGLTVIAASLATAFGTAQANWEFDSDEESLAYHSRPESMVRFGLGYLNKDAARFGQFTGLDDMGLYAIGEVRLVKLDDATGTWMRLDGRNLGLESRNLRFEHEAQGNWRYILDYRKSPRYSPYTFNTGLGGMGSDNQTVNAVPLRDTSIKTMRESVGLAGEKILGHGFDLKVNFKQETKKGERLFGRHGPQFLTEPIDHEMRQVDVVLGYTGQRLQLSGGYYGSFFRNDDKTLTSGGNIVALSPDNQAHQFHLAGGYSFTPTTRGNFKVARSVATQRDTFGESAHGLLPGVRNHLSGKVVTTLAQAGISARPTSDLSLRANLKYEDRDDKTPIRQYINFNETGGGYNHPRDFRQLKGNVEASYRLPENFRLTGAVEYDKRTRNTQDVRSVSFRRNTEEKSYRVALSRSLSPTLNGSLAYLRSERDGSRFLTNYTANTTTGQPTTNVGSNLVAPLHLADRDRDTVRLRLDWMPTEALSLAFLADVSHDKYGGRELGPHKRRAHFLSVDASYAISHDWQGHAWITRDYSRAINRTRATLSCSPQPCTPPSADWQAALRQSGDAFGLGLRGRATEKLEVGADFQFSRDRSSYGLSSAAAPLAGYPPIADLPSVKYSLASLKLSAKYAMQRDLALRFDVIHDRWRTNDWMWSSPTLYTDGTTVLQDRRQNATFVGVSVQYNWR